MKVASTDTQQYRDYQTNGKAREQNRNFWIAVLQSTFMRISFAFADPRTVLSAFVYKLTSSNTLVGLTGSLMGVGWMWPQLFISNLLEHRPRKMPFYILGMSIRFAAWLAIFLCTRLIGDDNDSLLATSFIFLYFIGSSSSGVSTVPYMDIISKAIEPHRRARVFSLGNFIGGSCTGLIGYFLVRHILSDESGFAFPHNYGILFLGVVIAGGIEFLIFLNLREPIRPVRAERRSFWQHLKQGPHFLRTDRNYQWFLLYRIGINIARMCMPFYVPYALSHFKAPGETIGLFLAVSAVSGVLSNAMWGYVGERYGVRWILIGTSLLVCTAPLVAVSVRYLPLSWQMPCYFLTFVCSGASMSGMMVGFMTYMINIAPPLSLPTYIGFLNTIVFPFGFMPVIAGQLVESIGYDGTFAIAIGLGVFTSLIATRLKDVYYEEDR